MRSISLAALFGLGELTPVHRRALPIIYASSISTIMGVNLLYPVLPAMMGPLNISESTVGLAITLFAAPSIVLAPILGVIADLRGRRLILAGGLVLFGLAGGAIAFAPDFGWVLTLRALQGVGMSGVLPLSIVLIGDLLQGKQETGAQGLKVFLDRIGFFLLPLLGGVLAGLAWSAPFLLFLATIPLGVAAFFGLPETGSAPRGGLASYLASLLPAARHPRLMAAYSAGFLRFFLDYGFFTYLPLFLAQSQGLSPASIGLLFGFYSAGAMLTASQAGRISERAGLVWPLVGAFAFSGACILLVPLMSSTWASGVILFGYGLANGLISPFQKSLLTQTAPREMRGGVVSVDRLVQQVSKSLSPALLGILLVYANLPSLFLLLGAVSLTGAAISAVVARGGGSGPLGELKLSDGR